MANFLSLITIYAIIRQRQQIHDQTVARNTWHNSYDYIVVGGGTAGCIVAKRLAEDPNVTVLLIEAGGAQDAISTDIPARMSLIPWSNYWMYFNERQENMGHLLPRINEIKGKILGGGSAVNLFIYNRGSRHDYDNYANTYGARGWSYEEVLPFFIKAENNSDLELVKKNPGYHGTDGPIGITSVKNPPEILRLLEQQYNSMGYNTIDINGAQQLGTAFTQSTIKDGLRSSTANAYLNPNPYPDRLHILARSLVTKILLTTINNSLTAIGVEFRKSDKHYTVYSTKEIIICGGPINSPQLLMLSGIGPKVHLEKHSIKVQADLPVGENYNNHPYALLPAIINKANHVNTRPRLDLEQLRELFTNHSGALSEFPVLYHYYSTSSNLNTSWPNVYVASSAFSLIDSSNSYFNFNLNNLPIGTRQLVMLVCLARVQSRGTIRLKSSNPLDHPLIDPKFLTHPQDMQDLIEAVKYVYSVLKSTPFSKHITVIPGPLPGCSFCGKQSIYECNTYIRCLIRQIGISQVHPVGSCRMGAVDRPDVVVDEKCRVKYVSRLRVADTSIYPETPNANTNAAAILAGEKCAQIIKNDPI